MDKESIINSNGFTLMELMVITAIIALLMAIAIPNYITIRNKAYCSQAEKDANIVSRAISNYFSIPSHADLPTPADIKAATVNPYDITGNPNTTIIIRVKDASGRCPDGYQMASKDWEALTDYFVLEIK